MGEGSRCSIDVRSGCRGFAGEQRAISPACEPDSLLAAYRNLPPVTATMFGVGASPCPRARGRATHPLQRIREIAPPPYACGSSDPKVSGSRWRVLQPGESDTAAA